MRLDKFTIKAQEALGDAQQLASEQGNSRIEPEHLLVVLTSRWMALCVRSWPVPGAAGMPPARGRDRAVPEVSGPSRRVAIARGGGRADGAASTMDSSSAPNTFFLPLPARRGGRAHPSWGDGDTVLRAHRRSRTQRVTDQNPEESTGAGTIWPRLTDAARRQARPGYRTG